MKHLFTTTPNTSLTATVESICLSPAASPCPDRVAAAGAGAGQNVFQQMQQMYHYSRPIIEST
eukprot:3684-Hanusia_phi.AAC.2